jgi:hypothetical protein
MTAQLQADLEFARTIVLQEVDCELTPDDTGSTYAWVKDIRSSETVAAGY